MERRLAAILETLPNDYIASISRCLATSSEVSLAQHRSASGRLASAAKTDRFYARPLHSGVDGSRAHFEGLMLALSEGCNELYPDFNVASVPEGAPWRHSRLGLLNTGLASTDGCEFARALRRIPRLAQ